MPKRGTRAGWLLRGGTVVAMALIGAACSSPAANQTSVTTTTGVHKPSSPTTTTMTSTTIPISTTTSPPVQSSNAEVTITGASATIAFTSAAVSGSLSPGTGTFGSGGTEYTFTVSGVQYSGSPSTTTATGGLITSVTVAARSGGALVTVHLSSAASHASFGLGHDQVGVSFS